MGRYGGPIALVRDGDQIHANLPEGKGLLHRYSRMVGTARAGAVLL